MKKRFYILLAVLALAAWLSVYILKGDLFRESQLNQTAPNFSLSDAQGKFISLDSLRGQVVLLNFWATWCGPCQEEMPSIEALYQKYRDRGFTVLAVSVDEEGWEAIHAFLKRLPLSFMIVSDQDQSVGDLYKSLRIPETYVIDRDGKIVDKFVGPQDYNQPVFFKKVEKLLPQP